MKVSGTNTSEANTNKYFDSPKKKPFVSDNSANVGIPLLKDGMYSEEESHGGFMNALNAWRDAGKTPEERKVIE
jgi:hypothetical protein